MKEKKSFNEVSKNKIETEKAKPKTLSQKIKKDKNAPFMIMGMKIDQLKQMAKMFFAQLKTKHKLIIFYVLFSIVFAQVYIVWYFINALIYLICLI